MVRKTLQRVMNTRTSPSVLKEYAIWWSTLFKEELDVDSVFTVRDQKRHDSGWVSTIDFDLTKTRNRKIDLEAFDDLVFLHGGIHKWTSSGKKSDYKWYVMDLENGEGIDVDAIVEKSESASRGQSLISEQFLTWEQMADKLDLLQKIVDATDQEIEDIPEFVGIYDRGPVLRIVCQAMIQAIETHGRVRDHALLYGPPAAAKSILLEALSNYLGEGCIFFLNADTMTAAGARKLFLDMFETIPCFMVLEEIEKREEEHLRQLLSVMDTRARIEIANARRQEKRHVPVMFLATCNDKIHLDMMTGGRKYIRNGNTIIEAGALSSRFVNALEVDRPDRDTMRRILLIEISRMRDDGMDARDEWAEICLSLADEIGTDDPRRIKAFLAGAHRLEDGRYREDTIRVHKGRIKLARATRLGIDVSDVPEDSNVVEMSAYDHKQLLKHFNISEGNNDIMKQFQRFLDLKNQGVF